MSAQKILIVDDNPVVLKAVQMRVAAAGYATVTAADGSEAIGVVRRAKPDLILLDICFPADMSGVAWDGPLLMQWLRRLEESRTTPIIVMTGQNPAKYRDQVMQMGAVAFFTKPVDNEQLIEAIRTALADPVQSEPAK